MISFKNDSDNLPYEKNGKEIRCIAEEVPFEIPDSWEWVRLGNLCNFGECVNVEPSEIAEDAWVLDLEDIEKDTGRLLQKKTKHETKCTSTKHAFSSGQILYSKLRPYLNKVLIAPADGVCTSEILPLSFWGPLFLPYIKTFLMSPGFVAYTVQCSYGVKMPRLGTEDGKRALFPLPPLAEQKRIVAKIEELLPHLDEYGQAETRVKKLNTEFPEQLKKSILQWAIQGKLVAQNPDDEPASVLLDRIRGEKAKLVKAGKIKKDKVESVIFRRDNSHYEKLNGGERCIDDEIPFEIPDSWVWVKLGAISRQITDGEHKTPRRINNYQGYYLLSARNIRDGIMTLEDVDYVCKEEYELISSRCNPHKGDVLISCSGSVGRICVVEDNGCYVMVRSAAMVSPLLSDSHYLMYALQSYSVQQQIHNKIKKAVQANLFQGAIRELYVPLPPLAEQGRIVAEIEKILALQRTMRH